MGNATKSPHQPPMLLGTSVPSASLPFLFCFISSPSFPVHSKASLHSWAHFWTGKSAFKRKKPLWQNVVRKGALPHTIAAVLPHLEGFCTVILPDQRAMLHKSCQNYTCKSAVWNVQPISPSEEHAAEHKFRAHSRPSCALYTGGFLGSDGAAAEFLWAIQNQPTPCWQLHHLAVHVWCLRNRVRGSSRQCGVEWDSQATSNNSRKRLLRKTPRLCVMGEEVEEKRGTRKPQ